MVYVLWTAYKRNILCIIRMKSINKFIIGLVVIMFFISGCSQSVPEQQLIETEANLQENIIEEQEPVEEKFEIFNPVLTYPNAYNGPLYGTSEQVGSASMDSYFENLDRNGINFFIGMFGISGEPVIGSLTSDQGLGEVIDAVQKHPKRVIPFFNPGIGGEEIQEKGYLKTDLINWYRNTLTATQKIAGNDFIRGFGEVETQEWSVRHNDPKIIELIDLARSNNINFMFHPTASKISDVKNIIETYPDTIFLIHLFREDLDKSNAELIKLLKEHDNLYFSMDAAHIIHIEGDVIYDFDSSNKESSIRKFVSYYDSNENTFVDKAIKASRLVIAGFDKEHQELVGYKNALRVFGEGVTVDSNINVLGTGAWPDCTTSQMDECDESCEIPDTDALTSEQEACFTNCIIGKRCNDAPEMDIG